MVAATFETVAFPFMLGSEGGFDNDPRDRGNWTTGVIGKGQLKGTKYGIASHVYPNLDIKNLTIGAAHAIYKRDYAAKVAYDDMPAGVDVSVYDMGVNAGPGRSLILLQRALGASTAAAATLARIANAAPDKVAVIKAFAAKRLAFYRSLKTFSVYGRGWTRRATQCEALSVKAWLEYGAQKPAPEIKKQLEAEAKQAENSAAKNAGGVVAGGGAAGTAGTQTHDWAWSWDWTTIGLVALGVIAALVIGYFVWKMLVHRQRAQAYAEAAQAV